MKNIFTVLLLNLFLFWGCKEDLITQPGDGSETTNAAFEVNVFPNIGGGATTFNFQIKETTGYEFGDSDFELMLDYDNDGTYEGQVNNKFEFTHVFGNPGKKDINGYVRIGTSKLLFTTSVIVTEAKILLAGQDRFIFEPQIYNSSKIVFTWGGDGANGHALHIMDYNGNNRTCIFCGVDGFDISEQHSGYLSPDGERIVWNTGQRSYLADMGQSSEPKIFFEPYYYEAGKMTWSLDSDKFFAIDADRIGVLYFSGNDFSSNTIIDYGEFISLVPGEENQIAVLTESQNSTEDSLKSNLQFYDITGQNVVKEFNDIPAFNSFRVIDNGNKLYFEKPMMIYDLVNEKAHYFWFDEIPFAQHMEGESDITIEGDKVIFSAFSSEYSERNLYSFDIPISEL